MAVTDLRQQLDHADLGRTLHQLCAELFPICRSLTGDGVRTTLDIVQRWIPLHVHEVPTGTAVLDWTVPKEWNVTDAYIADTNGRRVVDFRESNLHVLGYSVPVQRRVPRAELEEHVLTLPDRPDWVPYRTSYYRETWGFCLSQRTLSGLTDAEYDVVIDASLEDGSLTYGEVVLPGEVDDEVLLSTHVCHPSLANDNASGIAALTVLGNWLAGVDRRLTYRLLFIPGTLGSITWLARNEAAVARVRHGLVLTGLGDPGPPTYKRSRRGRAEIDRAASHVLRMSGRDHDIRDFDPYGYDERQFCSPGFNLGVGRFGRSPHGEYPEYHTSADNLEFLRPECLADSFDLVLRVIEVLEGNGHFVNRFPKGEPQLGRRGLYRSIGGEIDRQSAELALLWVLNLSDGQHSLLDVAERAALPFEHVRTAADALLEHDLLAPAPALR